MSLVIILLIGNKRAGQREPPYRPFQQKDEEGKDEMG